MKTKNGFEITIRHNDNPNVASNPYEIMVDGKILFSELTLEEANNVALDCTRGVYVGRAVVQLVRD